MVACSIDVVAADLRSFDVAAFVLAVDVDLPSGIRLDSLVAARHSTVVDRKRKALPMTTMKTKNRYRIDAFVDDVNGGWTAQ